MSNRVKAKYVHKSPELCSICCEDILISLGHHSHSHVSNVENNLIVVAPVSSPTINLFTVNYGAVLQLDLEF